MHCVLLLSVGFRYVSGSYKGPYLPQYAATPDEPKISYGLRRLDHAVGNVHELLPAVRHIMGFTGEGQRGKALAVKAKG